VRFKINLNAVDKKIPIGNRFMVCSLLKKAIEIGDSELFNEIYFYEDKKNKKIKDFSFAIYLRDFKVEDSYINVNGDISITVGTPDYNLGIVIYNGLLKIKTFNFKGYDLELKTIALLKEAKVKSSKIPCKTLSPVFIKDGAGKGIDVHDSNFEEGLNYISNLYLEIYRGYGLRERLKFTPINMKKTVVKEEVEGFKEETNKQFLLIDSYKGIFNLSGDESDLQILLEAGIGYRRSQGFGLIDLV
jgi:CRISPR-associated endoribonuclease Cas6